MNWNLWRRLRLAGGVVVLITAIFSLPHVLYLVGLMLTGVGTVNGLLALEERVTKLEEAEVKRNEKIEA